MIYKFRDPLKLRTAIHRYQNQDTHHVCVCVHQHNTCACPFSLPVSSNILDSTNLRSFSFQKVFLMLPGGSHCFVPSLPWKDKPCRLSISCQKQAFLCILNMGSTLFAMLLCCQLSSLFFGRVGPIQRQPCLPGAYDTASAYAKCLADFPHGNLQAVVIQGCLCIPLLHTPWTDEPKQPADVHTPLLTRGIHPLSSGLEATEAKGCEQGVCTSTLRPLDGRQGMPTRTCLRSQFVNCHCLSGLPM